MTAREALDPEPLLRFLHEKGVAHIIIGGVAVAAHGYVRPTKDLDVVPAPDRANLVRLADERDEARRWPPPRSRRPRAPTVASTVGPGQPGAGR